MPTSVGYFSNWVVKMPDNTIYYFNGSNQEKSFEIEANEIANRNNTNYPLFFDTLEKREAVISTWYLDTIETSFGYQTSFNYHPTQYSYYRLTDHTATTTNCTFIASDKKINRVFIKSAALFKISNITKTVE